ncbi:hypothetical protein GCM10017567_12390 [Amycolatopsis bullii]|uniref:Uncharacterized protein n=1 Tax=Amycolatopsis bullii TaxID=941987 RepID=A0ABQ3K7S6_9PSEU|nr:hypothetical protein GCM10017567_12390 [Amycolatopsis bullii]
MPALMELAVAAARPGALASLRLVMLSGDWIRVGPRADIARACPDAKVISLGGATEASIWSILPGGGTSLRGATVRRPPE